ncbi:hypothetical protein [Archangium lipolyticum]|uniref:hypothetical protein n=1 Tax=Archangium lipolyticum TaxID=2970465 RepID=UPI002149E83D|nr:hypothetical protein [Archangium lipolyticum]
MDVRDLYERERRARMPLLSAFDMQGEIEDGLTDSRRTVFRAVPCEPQRPEPLPPPMLLDPEPVTDPFSMAWVARGVPAEEQARQESRFPAVRRAGRFLDLVSVGTTRRVSNEEIGDALERLDRVAAAGAPTWVLYLMVSVTALWVATHSVQELTFRFVGKVRKVFSRKSREDEKR